MNQYSVNSWDVFGPVLSMFSSLAISIWYVWILLIILVIFKTKLPYLIGRLGEKFVTKKLLQLDLKTHKVLNDLLLPSNGHLNATQIDHVVVSNFGIFCIETKSYKGWIFGNTNDEYWTQVIYKHKERFYNPLRQNYAHRKAVEELIRIKYPKASIFSLIAFPDAEKLQISGPNSDLVGYASDIKMKIENYKTKIFTDAERDDIHDVLVNANIRDKGLRKMHDKGVRDIKNNKVAN